MTAGGMLAKGIGALYRVTLTALLGSYGMGLYQMAYPLFVVMLTFSSAGIPSAFSRVIAAERARGAENGETVRGALRLFLLLGISGGLIMALAAYPMEKLQGEGELLPCYLALAPAVAVVALIAVLRGYFQGKHDMVPTAVSELIEQSVKAGAGLFFAYRYANDPGRGAFYALAAVSISELFALFYLIIRYRAERHGKLLLRKRSGIEILETALPVMAASALLPFSQTADSVILVRLISRYSARAVSLYGLYAGGAVSLVSLPATVCYGLAASVIPGVSAAFATGQENEGRRRAVFALCVSLCVSIPCAAGLYFFAPSAVKILYPRLSSEDAALLVRLVKISSVSAVFLAGCDVLAACLTGMGRAKYAAYNMAVAVAVKLVLQYFLAADPKIGIAGAAIASNFCYLIAFFLNLVYTVKKGREKGYDHDRKSWDGEGRPHIAGEESACGGGRGARPHGRNARGADA